MMDFLSFRLIVLLAGLVLGGFVGVGIIFLATSGSEPDPSPTVKWASPIEVASGDAHRGPWRMNDSDWRFVDDPTVALTDDGVTAVAWTDHVRQDLFFQRYDSMGEAQLKEPVNVSQNPDTFSWLPRMVFSEEDPETIYVLWQEIIFSGGTHGGEILFSRSTDAGRTFADPINLSNTPAGAGKGRLTTRIWHNGSLDIAVGPEGTLYTAWTEYEGALRFSRSTDGGTRFSDPRHVAGTEATPARGPSLAVGPSGRVHLAWTVGEDPEADLRYARSDDEGHSFGEPIVVDESSGHSDAPSLAVGPAGTLHLAYGERPKNSSAASHVLYARAAPETGAFEAPKRISERNAESTESAHFPTIRTIGPDSLAVVWERFPEGSDRSRGLRYMLSMDGGVTFTSPELVAGSADSAHGFNGSQQGLLMEKLATNAGGALAVVNSTFQPGDASHIWLYRGKWSGH